MKALLLALWLALPAAAQIASTPAAIPQQEDAGARKARALLNQAVQALGGAAYLNYQDMQQHGRSYAFYHGQPKDIGVQYWLFWKWPDCERIELTKQRDVIYVYNGDKGYEITYKGTSAEDDAVMTEYKRQREFSLASIFRRWLNDPTVTLFNEGRAFVDNKPADQVTLMNGKNQAVTLYLDPFSHLPLKKTYSVRDPVSREHDEEGEVYDSYHMAQGINTPYSLVRLHNGEMTRQRFITTVSYNSSLADSQFEATVNYDPYAKQKK